jgi:hypothetical protein
MTDEVQIGGLGSTKLHTGQRLPRAVFTFWGVSTNVRFRLPSLPCAAVLV